MRGRGRGGREGAQGGRAAERRHARVPPARVRGRRDLNGGERAPRAAAGPRASTNTSRRRAALAQRCGGLCPEGVDQWGGAGEMVAAVCHRSSVAQMRRDATNVSRAALSYFTRCLTQDLTQACSSVLQLGGQSMRCV